MRGPWAWRDENGEPPAGAAELRALLGQLKMAVFPLALTGTGDQQARAREILTQSRTALYRILAEEADATSAPETAAGPSRAQDTTAAPDAATAPDTAGGPQATADEQGK
jgi:hypothetical protein